MAANASSSATELHVRPTGWESNAESEQFPISLMGHTMPKIYVLIAEVFRLPEDANIKSIVGSMSASLEYSLAQFPILTASLEMDPSSGQMWAKKKRDSALRLHVKHMGVDEFPSYAELAAKHFPANLLEGRKLLPEAVTAKQLFSPLGDNDENGIPVAALQLNFIAGGLVLGLAIHHVISDGPGCDGFLTAWAENSSALAHGVPFPPAKEPFVLQGSPLDPPPPTPEEAKTLQDAFPMLKDDSATPPAPLPEGFTMPALSCQMFHFPTSKAALLKASASQQVSSGWISTYDALLALLWARITAAKLPLLQVTTLSTPCTLIHAVDTRRIWNPPLPERFLGVAAFGAHVPSVPLSTLLSPSSHGDISAAIRASTASLIPSYLTSAQQWIDSRPSKLHLGFSLNSFLGIDLGASSWASMTAYRTHDFGFGVPAALRVPSPAIDGFVYFYPSRKGMKGVGEDEGFEVCVCLEEGCMTRLMQDEEFVKYAEARG